MVTQLFRQTQENSGSVSMNYQKDKDKINQALNGSFST